MDIFKMTPRILVLGDIMLDHNITTKITKVANEAPIAVFEVQGEEYKLGGAGNVAHNLVAMGAHVGLVGCVGDDRYGAKLHELLGALPIHNSLIMVPGLKTTTKTRYFSAQKLVFRADYESVVPLAFSDISQTIQDILESPWDCIVFSDYNKGFLTKELCQFVIQKANQKGIITCVDPKNDFTKYIGCTLIKPNRTEAFALYSIPTETPVDAALASIHVKTHCKYAVMTLAEEGIVLYDGSTYRRVKPANRYMIIDVTGAGDVVCSVLGFFLSTDVPLEQTLRLATELATLSIEHPGVYSITKEDMMRVFLTKQWKTEELHLLRSMYPDKKLVFTNGCFDIVHKGHMDLLKFCKKPDSIVVVGLNSDASIRRLKGPTRPIHTLENRLAILESNQYVDHIVVFEEDTPFALLQSLQPDVIVKGGDYTLDQIVGREYAKEVERFPLVADISTTCIVERIRERAKEC